LTSHKSCRRRDLYTAENGVWNTIANSIKIRLFENELVFLVKAFSK